MFKTKLKKRSTIQIVPMIDVIFFLLIFFMLFTTFRITPEGLDIQLPQAVTVTGQEEESLEIAINRRGELFLDGEEIDSSFLRDRAQIMVEENPNLIVIIKADEEVSFKRVVHVMDTVRMVGAHRIALAADRKFN